MPYAPQSHSSPDLSGILLLSDIDGTLITKEFTMPQRNVEAVRRFIAEGGSFAVASGRTDFSAGRYLGEICPNVPSVLCNGSLIYDFSEKKVVWYAALPDNCREMAVAVAKRFPDVGIEAYFGDIVYILNVGLLTKQHIIDEHFEYTVTDAAHTPPQWYKLLFAAEPARLKQVEAFLERRGHTGSQLVFSNVIFLEVLPEGVSKGTSMLRVARMLGIDRQNVAAIGDYYNDLEMLRLAGIGIVPANAPSDIQAAAAKVVGRCETGAVADVIEWLEQKRR